MSQPSTERSPVPVTGHQHPHVGPMGRGWPLALYDPLARVLGVRSVHRRLLAAADLRPGHRVLDIGCGTGNLALLAKAQQPGATVVGLDPDLPALGLASRKARRRHLEVQLDQGSADALPYPDASFDRVLSSLMLHHLPGEQKLPALREALRVLRPGGELHLVDFGGDGGEHQGGGHGRRMAGRAAQDWRVRDQLGSAVPDLLRQAGFTDVGAGERVVRLRLPLTSHRAVRPR